MEAGFWLVGSLVALRIEPKASNMLGNPLLLSYTLPALGLFSFLSSQLESPSCLGGSRQRWISIPGFCAHASGSRCLPWQQLLLFWPWAES